MKIYLKQQVEGASSPIQAGNLVREYLQARILESLQNTGGMIPLAFQGGTALRFLYGLPRYSEDLDFTLEGPSEGFDLQRFLNKVQRDFEKEDYNVRVKVNAKNVVQAAFFRFPGLLYELGLPSQPGQVLSVKLEIDTKPPAGAGLEISIVRHHVTLRLQHHDRSSLFAGKLHALLQRNYVKGRDIYDLFWYLSNRHWPEPNLTLLNNALEQTGWKSCKLSRNSWQEVIRQKIQEMSWERVRKDVAPFLEKDAELDLLTRDNLLVLLK